MEQISCRKWIFDYSGLYCYRYWKVISHEKVAYCSKVSTHTLIAIEKCKIVFKITIVIKVLMGLKFLNIDINNLIIEFQYIYMKIETNIIN